MIPQLLVVLMCCLGVTASAVPAAERVDPAHLHHNELPGALESLPGGSVLQLPIQLQETARADVSLSSFAGRPVLVSMMYTRCTAVCPVLVLTLQRIVATLTPQQLDAVSVLIVSLDSEYDTPQALAAFATEHRLNGGPWHLAHASADDVRLLASALGIRYRKLPDGSFSHSALITLLDRSGVPIARTEQINAVDESFVATLHSALP